MTTMRTLVVAPVQGEFHRLHDFACEDRNGSYQSASCAIIALADGHGDKRYCRAAQGAQLAVDVALRDARELFDPDGSDHVRPISPRTTGAASEAGTLQWTLEWMCRRIVRDWSCAVSDDLKQHPFDWDTERKKPPYEGDELKQFIERIHRDPKSLYGSTLLVAGMTERIWFAAQLGDGTIAVRRPDGYRILSARADAGSPCLADPRILDEQAGETFRGSFTDSLCQDNAAERFIILYGIREDDEPDSSPLSIMISSDGLDNCFQTYDRQVELYNAVMQSLASDGDETMQALERFWNQQFEHLSATGSKDDITFAAITRNDNGQHGKSEPLDWALRHINRFMMWLRRHSR